MPHPVITREQARQGGLTTAARKREKVQPFRQRVAAAVDRELEDMIASFRTAWQAGDWRAAQALMHEAYGLPTQRVEVDRDVTIVVRSVLEQPAETLELGPDQVQELPEPSGNGVVEPDPSRPSGG